VLLYSFDLYDGDPKSMRFIPQLLNYFKVSDFYLGTKEWNLRDKIILPVSAIPIIAIFPLNPKSSILF
jgi:hypothetical protein